MLLGVCYRGWDRRMHERWCSRFWLSRLWTCVGKRGRIYVVSVVSGTGFVVLRG